jgi:glycosyltransferase involved in cell wall biosynthesis
MNKDTQVLIVCPMIAHYREELFSSISSIFSNVTIASDFRIHPKIKNLNISQLSQIDATFKFVSLKNLYFNDLVFYQKGLLKIVSDKKIVNVLAVGNVNNLTTWLILIFKKFLKINVTLWTHGNLCDKRNIKYRIKNFMFSKADKVVFYEKRSESIFKKDYQEKITSVCYNSYKYAEFKKLRHINFKRSNKINHQQEYFCFIGRLTEQKKLTQILNSLNYIQNIKKLNIGFVFVGSGPEKQILETQVKNYNLINIDFIPAIYDSDELHQICIHSKGMVSPGNVGLTAITALSCGIPVITHDNFCNQMPEVGSLIKDKTGYFFKENDFLDLSNKLISLSNSEFEHRDLCYEILDSKYNPKKQSYRLLKQYLNI